MKYRKIPVVIEAAQWFKDGYLLALILVATQAQATQRDHCKPEPKPRDPPAVSRPEPKAEPRASRTPSDHDRPCDRTIGAPVWCRVLK